MHTGAFEGVPPPAVRSNLKIGIFIGEKRRRPFGQIRPALVQRASEPCFGGGPRAPAASLYFYPNCRPHHQIGMLIFVKS